MVSKSYGRLALTGLKSERWAAFGEFDERDGFLVRSVSHIAAVGQREKEGKLGAGMVVCMTVIIPFTHSPTFSYRLLTEHSSTTLTDRALLRPDPDAEAAVANFRVHRATSSNLNVEI